MEPARQPLVVIIGPTGSGKTAAAVELAKLYHGEIICADSRTIYNDLNIGTAKPTLEEQQGIPHHGLDLIDPDQHYSAAEFKRFAERTVKDIRARGKLPIMAGGTGLYVDGYIYDFSFAPLPEPALRAELEAMDLEQLQARARQRGIVETDVDFNNPRHLGRAVERGSAPRTRGPLPAGTLLLGLQIEREQLRGRITKRVDTMFASGLIEEVQNIIAEYGADAPGMLAPGYKAVSAYLNDKLSLEEAKRLFIRSDMHLAKRQMTWFRRNPDIIWCSSTEQVNDYVSGFLDKFATI
jgi:tRNA dimethylallyltransferase